MSPPSAVEVPAATDTQAATFVSRLDINGVQARRTKAPKMASGVAPHASSDMFKGSASGKPMAERWDDFLTEESKSRKPSTLKGAAKYLKTPGLISLGGGLPSSENFPIERIDIKVPRPPHFSENATKESGTVASIGKHDIAEGKGVYDLHVALNYGQATGSIQLLRFVTEHTEIVHDPPYQDWQCTLNVGSTSALDVALRMFANRGDFILTEEYTFSSAVETGLPMGVRAVGIKMDKEGLLPAHMDEILSTWDAKSRGGPKPRLLYTVPTGQNPTGATQSEQRRKDLYAIAQKHGIYIFEDEPYYFLQMQPYTGSSQSASPPSSHADFLKALVPSLLSIDTDGRVMRMDSFSKVIAPGSRTGWITASEQIVERFIRHYEVCCQNPSGISQIVLHKLLDDTWGHDGYLDWLIHLRLEYTRRRDGMLKACEEFLPAKVAVWDPPTAGMFHWIKIDHTQYPGYEASDPPRLAAIEEEIFQAGIDRGVLTSRGSWFRAEKGDVVTKDTYIGDQLFFRATFAAASEQDIREAIKRFGEGLKAVFKVD